MLLPQKQEISRIQINHSQLLLLLQPQSLSHPQPLFPPRMLPKQPFPLPQKHNKRRIQMMLFPHPLLQVEAQPQLVAVKSLMSEPPKV